MVWCGVCIIILLRVMRARICIYNYIQMLHNIIRPYSTKNPQLLEPQGFADFVCYAKHGYNLYYTCVFSAPSYGKPGVFSDELNENRKKTGCCTHTNTPRNSPTLPKPHPLPSLFPFLLLHCQYPLIITTPCAFCSPALISPLVRHSCKHL